MRLLPILALGCALVVVRALDIGAFLGVTVERSIVGVLFAGFIGYALTVLWTLYRPDDYTGSQVRRFLFIFFGILLLAFVASGAITASPRSPGIVTTTDSGFGPFTVWPSLTVSLGTLGLVAYVTIGRFIQMAAVSLLLALVVQEAWLQRRTSACHRPLGTGFGTGLLGTTACPACGFVPMIVAAFSTAGAPLLWDPSSPLAAVLDVVSIMGPLSVLLALKSDLGRPSVLGWVVLPAGLIAPAVIAVLGMPDGASERQEAISNLYLIATVAAVFLVLVTLILLIGFGIRYRDRQEAPRDHTLTTGARTGIQALYIAVPVVIIFGVGVLSYLVVLDLEEAPEDAYEIEVMATQFAWRFTYPDDTSTTNELRLRAGDPVVLHVTSDDVIHSLFIPDMGVKIDAAPGLVSQSWFQSHSEGQYPAYCVEYCGVGHAGMQANIVVYPSDGPRPTGETGEGPP